LSFFSRIKKKLVPPAAPPAFPDTHGSWEPAIVFFAHPPPGVVHMIVRPTAGRVDGLLELDASSDLVPVELREQSSRVEVLVVSGRILGVRPAGPGVASWFAQSRELGP